MKNDIDKVVESFFAYNIITVKMPLSQTFIFMTDSCGLVSHNHEPQSSKRVLVWCEASTWLGGEVLTWRPVQ